SAPGSRPTSASGAHPARTGSPWAAPVQGLTALATFWEDGRDGPDEDFTLRSSVVAVDGTTAVVRVEGGYGSGDRRRDLWLLWLLELTPDGRCRSFEEWPIAGSAPSRGSRALFGRSDNVHYVIP